MWRGGISQPFQLSFVLSLVVRGFSLVPFLTCHCEPKTWQSHSIIPVRITPKVALQLPGKASPRGFARL